MATGDAKSEPEADREGDAPRSTGRARPIPTTVAPDEEGAIRCPYCERPFRTRRQRSLHRGRDHPDRLSDRERAAFERARREEAAALRRFRLHVLGSLVLLYFVFLIVYAIVV